MSGQKFYSEIEEKANYMSHGLGVIVAFFATFILIGRAIKAENMWAVIAFLIYGFGMLACMLSSTFYHFVKEPKRKSLLRHFDHASIYVLIAASFSPVTLILLRNEGLWGWGLFAMVWFIAIIGIAFSFGTLKKNNNLKTASYVVMGLSVLVAVKPLISIAVSEDCVGVLYWLVTGGFFYIVGSFFYALAKREFIHTIFHIFVLLGLICHIVSAFLIPL